jgi:hypothetical protein
MICRHASEVFRNCAWKLGCFCLGIEDSAFTLATNGQITGDDGGSHIAYAQSTYQSGSTKDFPWVVAPARVPAHTKSILGGSGTNSFSASAIAKLLQHLLSVYCDLRHVPLTSSVFDILVVIEPACGFGSSR